MFQPRGGAALGALPAFPGVGTPRGNGFSCGCGKALPPSTWRRPESRGVTLAVRRGVWRLETHSQPVPHPGEGQETGTEGFQVRKAVGHCVPLLSFYSLCVAHRFGTPPHTYTRGHCRPSKSEVLCPGSGLRLELSWCRHRLAPGSPGLNSLQHPINWRWRRPIVSAQGRWSCRISCSTPFLAI